MIRAQALTSDQQVSFIILVWAAKMPYINTLKWLGLTMAVFVKAKELSSLRIHG